MTVRIQSDAFEMGAELNLFQETLYSAGAIVTFNGLVRDVPGGLKFMEIEYYPGMTQKSLELFEATAISRWQLEACLIIHRFGQLKPGELIMMVATAAPHRVAAFEAAEFIMDFLKSRAPFWKKEISESGEVWVDATLQDEAALRRW